MISPANHVPLSPLSFLARAQRVFPEKVAVVDGDGTPVSYAEFGSDCDALAGALRADDVRAGTGWPCSTSTAGGCWLPTSAYPARRRLVALNTRLAAGEYRDILAHSRARILFVSAGLLPRLAVSSAAELPVRRVVLLPGAPAGALPGAMAFEEWVSRRDGQGSSCPPARTT